MKIEAPIFETISETNKVIPQVILDRLHESEERKGLVVEARLIDQDAWEKTNLKNTTTFKQCMRCNKWATNPTNEPRGVVTWKTIDEFDSEEKEEFNKALSINPNLTNPRAARGDEQVGQTTGLCPSCSKEFLDDFFQKSNV